MMKKYILLGLLPDFKLIIIYCFTNLHTILLNNRTESLIFSGVEYDNTKNAQVYCIRYSTVYVISNQIISLTI
jgi:hypothetical protein